jgi:hypothetical protein
MCALIASGYNPKVSKAVLMALKRMALYLKKHHKLVGQMGANITLLDEETIEFLNAKIGRWFNAGARTQVIQRAKKSSERSTSSLSCASHKRPRASGCGPHTCCRRGPRRMRSSKSSC